jgi:hypothetical protein
MFDRFAAGRIPEHPGRQRDQFVARQRFARSGSTAGRSSALSVSNPPPLCRQNLEAEGGACLTARA